MLINNMTPDLRCPSIDYPMRMFREENPRRYPVDKPGKWDWRSDIPAFREITRKKDGHTVAWSAWFFRRLLA